jgi:hypothetical protein
MSASNIQLSTTDQRNLKEDEAHKKIYGWNENESDEGYLLAKILQVERGRSIANYESRAHIFGRSVGFFGTRKIENGNYKK